MTIYAPGQSVPLTAEFFTSSDGGVLTDVPSLTIAITDPSAVVEVATTSVGITHATTGVYRYSWTVPAGAASGDHIVTWTAGSTTAVELVTVAAAQSAWCSVADVFTYTGTNLDDTAVARASAVLDLHIGRTYFELVGHPDGGIVKVGRRDRQWLAQACAYQAVWMKSQPDMFDRMDLTQIAMDHRALTMRDQALTLAPLARKALKRVSWLRSRSLHVRTPFTDGIGAISPALNSEANDAYEGPWIPLGAD